MLTPWWVDGVLSVSLRSNFNRLPVSNTFPFTIEKFQFHGIVKSGIMETQIPLYPVFLPGCPLTVIFSVSHPVPYEGKLLIILHSEICQCVSPKKEESST